MGDRSPYANDFSNLRPSLISFRTGGLITGFLGILMMPWKLKSTYSSYLYRRDGIYEYSTASIPKPSLP